MELWIADFISELSIARNGTRKKVFQKYIKMTGMTRQTLYRVAGRAGYKTARRKPRADNGKTCITEEQLSFIHGLMHHSSREVKGVIMPVETALSIAEDNNIIEPGIVSVSRLQKILNKKELSKKAINTPAPHIKMRSLHPNHVHVFDASICIQYYLKKGTGLCIMREDMFYKNKPDNFSKKKERIIRYVLVDHFSGCIYLKYYMAQGENQQDVYDLITSAWAKKQNKFPFRGVPFFVLMDAGAANISKSILGLFSRLEIEIPKSLPHNPRRQGAAEVIQNIVESKFESRLRFQPAYSIEELNTWALDWCIWFNATAKHSRHGMTRTQCWLSIKKEQLRELPEPAILHYLFARPGEDRRVSGDYTISFKSQNYSVKHIENIIPNRSKVSVILRPYIYPVIGIQFQENEYQAKPIGVVEGSFSEDAAIIGQEFSSMPETITETAKKQADMLAYGENKTKDSIPYAGITVFGNHAEKITLEYLPKAGVEILVNQTGFENREISIMEFLQKLLSAGVGITPDLNRAIKRTYGKTISLTESQRLFDIGLNNGLSPADIGGMDVDLQTATS